MDRWTEDEFLGAARKTRISERTLEACKDVLVDGLPGVVAAEKHKMFPAQISRAIAILREKQAEMNELACEADEVLQEMASEAAKALFGQQFPCALAQPGQTYEGPLVVQSKGYAVQKVGRLGVLHNLESFGNLPLLPLRENVRIGYDKEGGLSLVQSVQIEEKGKGPER